MKTALCREHLHQCLQVYPDGEREQTSRRSSQVPLWLKSNITFHPAAALFVDGQQRYQGHLTDEEIRQIEGASK
jgi:hypothetical protein